MSEYINLIKRNIDGLITDIYLHDERVQELVESDNGKALVVYNAGTESEPNYKLHTATLHYVPVDGEGALTDNLNAGGYKIVNLIAGSNATDAVNKSQLDAAIAGIGTVLKFKGIVDHITDLPTADSTTIGWVYIVKYNEDEEEINKQYVGTETTEGGTTTYSWEPIGATIDLSGYLEIENLAKTTGTSEETAMTQLATTQAINAVAQSKIENPQSKVQGQILSWNGSAWVAIDVPDTGVLSVTASDNSISVDNSDNNNPRVGVKLSPKEGNLLHTLSESGEEGLFAEGVNPDWNETSQSSPSFIQNKPTLGTASSKDSLVGNIKDNTGSGSLVSSKQVSDYVLASVIYEGPEEPTNYDIVFWWDTTTGLLKHRVVDSADPYTYHWEAVGDKVQGVKGNKELTYRDGNVNLSPNDIGSIENPEIKSENQYLRYNGTNWESSDLKVARVISETLVLGTPSE